MSNSQNCDSELFVPQSLEAEQSVLGCVLKYPACIHKVLPILREWHFYAPRHCKIWEAIICLSDIGEPIDIITVVNELSRRKPEKGNTGSALESMGGRTYLVEIVESVISSINVEKYADIVLEKWEYRSLINICNEVSHGAYQQLQLPSELMAGANREISKIVTTGKSRGQASTKSVIIKIMSDLDRIAKKEITKQISFGFYQLDELASNRKGELIIIGGRPGGGKTSFMLDCAFLQAVSGKKVGFFSAETRLEELTLRLLCMVAQVNSRHATRGELEDEDWTKLVASRAEVEEADILIDDSPQIDIDALVSKSHGLVNEQGVEIIYVDFLQYLTSTQKFSDHRFRVGHFAERLKGMAQDLEIPVVVASQVSRQCDTRGRTWRDKRPRLSDLRESGSIEEVADIIIFLFRPILHIGKESNDWDRWQDVCIVDVAKQRNGPTGECELAFIPRYTRFGDLKGKQDTLPF